MPSLLDYLLGQGTPLATDAQGQITGAAAPPTGGLLGGFRDYAANNSDRLMSMGMGFLSGANQQEGFANAMTGMQRGALLDRQRSASQQAQAQKLAEQQARQGLAKRYNLPTEAAALPGVFDSAVGDRMDPNSGTRSALLKQQLINAQRGPNYEDLAALKAAGATPEQIQQYFKAKVGMTPDKPKVQFIKGEDGVDVPVIVTPGAVGQNPSVMDLNGKPYAPSGEKKITPLPAEVAGRVALAETYLQNAPTIREKIKSGGATGIWDATLGAAGVGAQGSLYGDIESGVDALRRGLTGAGMAESEADSYARRYLPTRKDTAETMLHKHDKLVGELQAIRLKQYEGRKKGVEPIPQGVPAAGASDGVPMEQRSAAEKMLQGRGYQKGPNGQWVKKVVPDA